MIIMYTFCKDHDEASVIAHQLLEKRLAACANIFPVESFYVWKDAVVDDKEIMLWIKTLKQNYNAVKEEIERLHSYEAPCIASVKVNKINGPYYAYLKRVVKRYYGKKSPLAKPNLKIKKL